MPLLRASDRQTEADTWTSTRETDLQRSSAPGKCNASGLLRCWRNSGGGTNGSAYAGVLAGEPGGPKRETENLGGPPTPDGRTLQRHRLPLQARAFEGLLPRPVEVLASDIDAQCTYASQM